MHSNPSKSRGLLRDFWRLRLLWPYLRQYRHLVFVAALLIPVIALLQMSLPLTVRYIIDDGVISGSMETVVKGATVFIFIVLAEYLSRAGQAIVSAFAVHGMIRDLREKLVSHIMRLSCRFHDKNLSGSLVTRATSDFDNLSESLNMGVLTSVVDTAVLIGCLIGLFILDWRLALCALVILPIVGIIVLTFSKALKQTMLLARSKIARLNAFTQECLFGQSTLKLLDASGYVKKRFDRYNVEYRNAQMKSVVLDASMFSIIEGIATITIGIILWVAVTQLTGVNALTAGVMIAFVQYIQALFEPLKNLGNKIAMLQGAFTSIDRIFSIFDKKDFISGHVKLEKLKGRVRFDQVSFSYLDEQNTETRVLDNVSFTIEAGNSLAIVGRTGSGKSTIIKLLSKLYDGYQGHIFIDSQDIANADPDSLREQIAIVPQDIVLFEGSVAFNIGLGDPKLTLPNIKAAAMQVGADRFIDHFPGGYDFAVTEQGKNLSHGQRQLIAFARALAKNPALIVLDEATSSVDPESERLVQQGIASMLAQKTVIVIAHRLSTIQKCDQIIMLESGRILEQGTHASLCALRGQYFSWTRDRKG